jgi:hypothetical protein
MGVYTAKLPTQVMTLTWSLTVITLTLIKVLHIAEAEYICSQTVADISLQRILIHKKSIFCDVEPCQVEFEYISKQLSSTVLRMENKTQ